MLALFVSKAQKGGGDEEGRPKEKCARERELERETERYEGAERYGGTERKRRLSQT